MVRKTSFYAQKQNPLVGSKRLESIDWDDSSLQNMARKNKSRIGYKEAWNRMANRHCSTLSPLFCLSKQCLSKFHPLLLFSLCRQQALLEFALLLFLTHVTFSFPLCSCLALSLLPWGKKYYYLNDRMSQACQLIRETEGKHVPECCTLAGSTSAIRPIPKWLSNRAAKLTHSKSTERYIFVQMFVMHTYTDKCKHGRFPYCTFPVLLSLTSHTVCMLVHHSCVTIHVRVPWKYACHMVTISPW